MWRWVTSQAYSGDFLKALIILVLVAFFGWKYYQQNANTSASEPIYSNTQPDGRFNGEPISAEAPIFSQPSQNFSCDGRQHCSQMTSREEAVFFIRNCPDTKMDGDHDGDPCENDSRF